MWGLKPLSRAEQLLPGRLGEPPFSPPEAPEGDEKDDHDEREAEDQAEREVVYGRQHGPS